MKPRFKPRVPNCSRVGCPNSGFTRIIQDGKQHIVCKACWLAFEDAKDGLQVKYTPPPVVEELDFGYSREGD